VSSGGGAGAVDESVGEAATLSSPLESIVVTQYCRLLRCRWHIATLVCVQAPYVWKKKKNGGGKSGFPIETTTYTETIF
jgi:hypothetical protein